MQTDSAIFTLFQGILISLSGVLAPGPLTAVVVGKGTKSPYAGALIGIGHGMVEIPLIVMICFGLSTILKISYFQIAIFLFGGIFLGLMAYDMFKEVTRTEIESAEFRGGSILAGIALSAGNPYFLLWWATVGAAIITKISQFGNTLLALFIALHLSCDVIWYLILSSLTYNSRKFFGNIFQKVLFSVCGIFLSFFSIKFIYEAIVKLLL